MASISPREARTRAAILVAIDDVDMSAPIATGVREKEGNRIAAGTHSLVLLALVPD